MNEVRRLRNELNRIQNELRRMNSEANRMRQQMVTENLKRLEDYRREMRTKLDQHDKIVQQEYERLLREYQKSIDRELQEQQLQMSREYQRLLEDIKRQEALWQSKTQELEDLIRELKEEKEKKDQISEEEARESILQAQEACVEVDQKAHEYFFPNRLNVLLNALRDARSFQTGGLNEAAIAIAVSVRSGSNRLGFDIDEKYEEWERLFKLFQNKTELLTMKTEGMLEEWFLVAYGSEKKIQNLSDKDREEAYKSIDFWSRGEFGDICDRAREFQNQTALIEKLGCLQYLKSKSEEGIASEDLQEQMKEIDRMLNRIEPMSRLFQARFGASCDRITLAEEIQNFLEEEVDLSFVEGQYKAVEDAAGRKRDYTRYMEMRYGEEYDRTDMREWYETVFENKIGTKYFVYIVPFDDNGKVENRIVLHIAFSEAENIGLAADILQHLAECCRNAEMEGVGEHIEYANDLGQLTLAMNATLRATGKAIERKIKEGGTL